MEGREMLERFGRTKEKRDREEREGCSERGQEVGRARGKKKQG